MDILKKYLLASVARAPETGGEAAASEQTPVADVSLPTHVAGGSGPLSISEAARSVIDWRRKGSGDSQDNAGADASAVKATSDPANESAVEAGSGGESPPAETEAQDTAAETLPPIEPPRSWSKEDKELFKALPRETQERLAERERSRDTDFSRRQQEATERVKALDAEKQRVEKARGEYESALPVLLQNLQAAYSGEFADIKTMDDVQKLAVSDPIRYTQWDAAQKRMAAVQQEVVAGQERQAAEYKQAFDNFRTREDALFAEKAPELSDPAQGKKLREGAVKALQDLGFKDAELGELWSGQRNISIHDHRLQLMLRDAVKWRDAQAQAKLKTANAKQLPPVQRPGAAQGANAAREANLKALNDQIDKSSGVNAMRAAAKLLAERRRAG